MSSPLYGVLQPNDDGSFTYYANHSVVTDDSFSFRACELVPVAPATTVLCSPVTPVTIDIVNPDEAIKVNWVSPVTNNRRWYMGTEDITLRVDIDNCPGCGVRFYRWDDPTQQYVEIATVTGGTTHTFSSSILNTGPGRFDGWNQVIANAVLPSGGLASQRAYIWLIRMPFDGPAKRVYFPLGAGK